MDELTEWHNHMPATDAEFQICAPVHKNTRNHQCKGRYFLLYLDWFALTMGTFYLFGGFFFKWPQTILVQIV